MANTYSLINSTSLSATATSVTFSAIPATFDDLELVISARGTDAAVDRDFNTIRFNGDTATNYSYRRLQGNGATASSAGTANATSINLPSAYPGANATASTFGNTAIYIPGYRVSQNKPISAFNAMETNATTAYLTVNAALWRNTAAITSIEITAQGTFAIGSTFWLYGIKNS